MPTFQSLDQTEVSELLKSRLRTSVIFAVDKDGMLKVWIDPNFSKDLSSEEEDRASGLMMFITGLIHEAKGSFEYFQQKGYDILFADQKKDIITDGAQKELNLENLEIKGTA